MTIHRPIAPAPTARGRFAHIDNSEATNGRIYTSTEIEGMTEADMIERRDQLSAGGFQTRAAELQRGWAFQHRFNRADHA
jgi:hypothetical protein